jgi:hypothetical protein
MLVRNPETCFTEEELFETLLRFAHRADLFDLEGDDFTEFGESLWEKLSVNTLENIIEENYIKVDIKAIENEIKEEFEEDTEDE